MSVRVAEEIRWIKRWPAVKLAVSRTPRARGRMNRLIVSIIIRTGISKVGVPSGRKCPNAWVGWVRIPIITVASQRGTARPILSESWVVGVKVYGMRPRTLRTSKKIIRDVKRGAHLCPPELSGRKSWLVKRAINHPWRVRVRLFNQRAEGAGKRIHGRLRAIKIRGIPRYVGLENWLKRLSVMVNFRGWFGGLLCFEKRVRWGTHVL